jgi:hypothetical protein
MERQALLPVPKEVLVQLLVDFRGKKRDRDKLGKIVAFESNRSLILYFNILNLKIMHKLKLSELNFGNAEVLTREQLKKVLGGQSSDPGAPPQLWYCNCTGGGSQGCDVTGTGESNLWFDNCCGYTGYVENSGEFVSNCY